MLNKQVQANKEGRVEEVNKDIIKFNDESVQMKEYYMKDMPEVLKEEAGLVKEKNWEKRSRKEKGKVYRAEKVDNYQGDQDIDTILENLEKPRQRKDRKDDRASVREDKKVRYLCTVGRQ